MGKTADLTVVKKTVIYILHKDGKPQTSIAKKADRVLYPSMLTEEEEFCICHIHNYTEYNQQ